jgi:hypothetical protein
MLAIIVPYYNFCQYESRRRNYDRFAAHMKQFPIRLITVECAIGAQEHQVTKAGHPDHLQVRAAHPLWFKENLINLGCDFAAKTDPSVSAYGWIDADLEFQNHQWVEDTEMGLQEYPVIQPFYQLLYLDKNQEPQMFPSYSYAAWSHKKNVDPRPGHGTVPGGAWVFRRSTFEQIGGLLECHITGGGDHYTTNAIVSSLLATHGIIESAGKEHLRQWMVRANQAIKTVGYIRGTVFHHYHGHIKARGYSTRENNCLSRFHYDPTKDLVKNADGVIQVTPQKPEIQKAIAAYFHSRQEDA